MCGLAGMIGPGVNKADLAFMRDLAYISGLRGMDSTGILQGNANSRREDIFMSKNTMDVAYWLYFHETSPKGNKRILNNISDNMFLLHTRATTIGEIRDSNAHPFGHGDLIGMHNGTLLDKKYRADPEKTDSEQLYMDIAARGLEAVMKDIDPSSAYALVYYNRRTHEITFFRNKMRTLFLAINQERAVMYYASERWMIEACAGRNGIKLGDIMYFEPGRYYTFRPDQVRSKVCPDWRSEQFFQPEPKVAAQATVNKSPIPVANNDTGKEKEGKSGDADSGNATVRAILNQASRTSTRVSSPPSLRVVGPAEPIGNGSNKPSATKPRKIPSAKCKWCEKSLDLYARYMASRDGGAYVCADCTARKKEIEDARAQQTAAQVRL